MFVSVSMFVYVFDPSSQYMQSLGLMNSESVACVGEAVREMVRVGVSLRSH